ncbi:MAG TPA: phosphotransferase [Ktedonobacteraceae bacterium]|nr:phosphotransferase [Ktedonobacteraceae bacterium]
MHICLIMDNPETPRHPVIAPVLKALRSNHTIRLLDVRPLTGKEAIAEEAQYPRADLYLLKSHAPQALEVARALEQQGALVVNSWASSVTCQDRVLMAQRMREANLPWPHTVSFESLKALASNTSFLAKLSFPVILKSRFSHRGDLVALVRGREQLEELANNWSEEPVVLQEYAAGDGWDIKLWVIDQQIFAARRRTPLEPEASKEDFVIPADELPADWAHIALEIGRIFNMRLYGVDLLMTAKGPIIVDVNGFPGFRGVPGADRALVKLVEKLVQSTVSIIDLPGIVISLFERAHQPLSSEPGKQVGLFVRYLRRKPARGLAVIYAVDKPGYRGAGHTQDPQRLVSLTLDEKALDGAYIRFDRGEAQEAALEVQPSGVLRAEELGLSVQAFPADNGLPALAASCDTSQEGPVFAALQQAARTLLEDNDWRLVNARAEAVRYKPASRCVVRYHLTLAQGEELRQMILYGKVYADPQQAQAVQALQQRLYDEQVAMPGNRTAGQELRSPILPRPLGLLADLGITLNEAIQPADPQERAITGTQAMQPAIERGQGGEIVAITIPVEELRMTAIALARLHNSAVRANETGPRRGSKEARRARERAALIAAHNPAQAEVVQQLAEQLASGLEMLEPDMYRPAHGGFKPSQLLFHSHQVFVVDFDGFCLADAALDVGYFLAYLRPNGLWYRRAGMREWFEAASHEFVSTYAQAMRDLDTSEEAIQGILERSQLYEAALIFKIATRRVNRLNSPRPKELSAMLDEIAACLSTNFRRM